MKKIKLIILLILSIISIIFVYNDYFLYTDTILKVTSINNKLTKTTINKEKYYTQEITGKIMNGKYKGKEVKTFNNISSSGVYGEKIAKNNELFVELSLDGENVIRIINIKRDKYIAILFVIFIDLIILIAGKKGIKTITSLIGNIIITILSIIVFKNNYHKINMLHLYLIIAVIFIIFSLYITNDKSKKTLAAIISSIVSLFISFGLCYLIIVLFGDDINIWMMEYIEVVFDYKNFFYVSILLSGLGGVMDIAITLSSALNELINKDKNITKSQLLNSGKEIAKDIIGTMTNVMIYTCYVSIIPTVLLALKNNMALANAITLYGNIELIIVLSSCVSITLAIPISLYVSILILKNTKEVIK